MVFPLTGLVIFLTAFSVNPLIRDKNVAATSSVADIKVLGTSNLHDWSMEDKAVSCVAIFSFAPGRLMFPGHLNLSVSLFLSII